MPMCSRLRSRAGETRRRDVLSQGLIDGTPEGNSLPQEVIDAHPCVCAELRVAFPLVDLTNVERRLAINKSDDEPLLNLASTSVGFALVSVQLVREPSGMRTEQLNLLPLQACFFTKLTPCRVDGLLPFVEAALGKLPAPRKLVSLQGKHAADIIQHCDPNVRSKELAH